MAWKGLIKGKCYKEFYSFHWTHRQGKQNEGKTNTLNFHDCQQKPMYIKKTGTHFWNETVFVEGMVAWEHVEPLH